MSREDVLNKTYLFIIEKALEIGLYDESICDTETRERQLKQLKP